MAKEPDFQVSSTCKLSVPSNLFLICFWLVHLWVLLLCLAFVKIIWELMSVLASCWFVAFVEIYADSLHTDLAI